MTESRRVVVGVDGSEESDAALRWAADLAAREGRPVVLVHAWIWPFFAGHADLPAGAVEYEDLEAEANAVVRAAIDLVHERHPDLDAGTEMPTTAPTVALRAASETAATVVVGSRGRGGFAGLLLGSVGRELAGHTACPLVVVRGSADPDAPVLVGIDDSDGAAAVLEEAFEQARSRGAELHAVHAWSRPVIMPDSSNGIAMLLHTEQKHARELLDIALLPGQQHHPDVKVTSATPPGSAAHALVEASEGCQLVVVGSRGRGGFKGLVLGSTSHALLHHAACPVMVLPQHAPATPAA